MDMKIVILEPKIILGKGGQGFVFKGSFLDQGTLKQVAVKRVQIEDVDTTCKQEEDALRELNHENVVKLFHAESNSDFRFYALELCAASVEKLFLEQEDQNNKKYHGPKPTPFEMLMQLAKGLAHIHEKKLVHRDLKPENALIWVGETQGDRQLVLMKWADFGLSKRTNERGSFSVSGIKGTDKWFAPEVLQMKNNAERFKDKIDVFSEGLTFAYILLEGNHPYGPATDIVHNISIDNAVNLANIEHEKLRELIQNMLKNDPVHRLSAKEAVEQLELLGSQNSATLSMNGIQSELLDTQSHSVAKPPGQVRVEKNSFGVVTLSWTGGETDDDLTGYLFQYRNTVKPEEPWISIDEYLQSNVITIDYLERGSYEFRVAAVTLTGGRSPFCPCSDRVQIDPVCPPPNELQIIFKTDASVTLSWNHEVNDVNILKDKQIASYSVECWMDGQEDSTFIQRTTKSKMVTIEPLVPNNVYSVKVRAVCKDATGSTFDGPSCPVLKVETERDAERLAQIVKRTSRWNAQVKFGIAIYNLTLRKPQGISTPGVDHYVFGELTYLALTGKRRRRTVLMVGATGSGKTTLINAMVNYVLGVKWEDDFRFKLIDEQTDKFQAHSQTNLITTYDLYETKGSRLEYSLTVVDTPGFGDTRGIEKDNKIFDQIQDYFKCHHGIRQLEAVCFVVEASLPRLTETQQYIFDSILSIFGNDIKDNIRLMVTFADNNQPPVLAAIKEAGIPSPVDQNTKLPLHHKFSSSIFFTSNKRDRRTNEINRTYFDMCVESFDRFFRDLSKMEMQSLSLTRKVLDERKQLHVLVEGLQMKIEIKLTRVNELEKIRNFLSDNKEQKKANKEFKFEFLTIKKIDIITGQFTTNCRRCKITCHFPCRQESNEKKKKCSIMDPEGLCQVCNCMWTDHFDDKYRYEMVKEKQSLDSIRHRYQGDASEALSNDALLREIQKDIDKDENQLLEMMTATSKHICKLDEIALRPHSFSTTAYIDLMIETEKKGDNSQEKIVRLEKLRNNEKLKQHFVEQEMLRENQRRRGNSFPADHHIDFTKMKNEIERIRRKSEIGTTTPKADKT